MSFWVIIYVSNALECYLVRDLLSTFWTSIHVMPRHKRGCDRRHHWKRLERYLFLFFLHNETVVLNVFTLRIETKICTLSVKIKFISTRCETGQKSSRMHAFLPTARTNTFYILLQCTYAICLSRYTTCNHNWSSNSENNILQ